MKTQIFQQQYFTWVKIFGSLFSLLPYTFVNEFYLVS